MNTKANKKDQPQKDDKQLSNNSELPEEEIQADQLELDSDIELEGLVDSITSKERSMKK